MCVNVCMQLCIYVCVFYLVIYHNDYDLSPDSVNPHKNGLVTPWCLLLQDINASVLLSVGIVSTAIHFTVC